MRGRSYKKTFIMICIVFLCIILAWVILDERRSQIIFTFCVLLLGAWVLYKGLEISGLAELISAIGIPFVPSLIKLLANSPFAAYAARFFNFVIKYTCHAMGITTGLQISHETSITISFWGLFAIIILVCSHTDHTAMKKRKGREKEAFREKNFTEKSQMFCTHLRQRLQSINQETDWNENLFTPIEAEVEINIKGKKQRKFHDLLKSLKSIRHSGSIFLVLGEPGSGKSVSLRKLCLDLLQESQKTKKIPVYINLKKWNKDWNLNCLPTKNDLINFIKATLREKGDFLSDDFINTYFDIMFEDGRWYFIFDSFDEMPCLMGKQNCQELIDQISELLYQFMTGAGQSGGVIASRLYKAPSESIGATVILTIQEFSDIKIKTMLQKYLNNAKTVGNELFGKRENLVALCRNPFYLTLLINYIRDKGLQFPKNQMELYRNFVEGRLEKCSGKLESENLTADEVHKAAKTLAAFMQDSTDSGLEYPTACLFQGSGAQYWRKTTRLLEYAKICRFGGSEETVTFVHRRFQEFFLVENILENGQTIAYEHYESIVRNSGMRDALVLYCEVAEEERAKEIAGFCWKTIQKNILHTKSILEEGSLELVNTLYFMTEAFRNRKSAIAGFEKDLEQLIEINIDAHTDFVVLLALTHSMVLFDQKYLQKIVLKVFQLKNCWLNDIIMQNCRIIKQLDTRIEAQFITYFLHMDTRTLRKRFRNTHFSLSLSKSFRYIKTVHMMIFLTKTAYMLSLAGIGLCLLIDSKQFYMYMMQNVENLTGFLTGNANPVVRDNNLYTFILYILCLLPAMFFYTDAYTNKKQTHIYLYSFTFLLPEAINLFTTRTIGLIWSLILISMSWMVLLIVMVHNRNVFKTLIKLKKILQYLSRTWCLYYMILMILLWIAICIILLKFKVVGQILAYVLTLIFTVYAVVKGTILLIHFFKDRHWMKQQLALTTIKRKDLAHNIEALYFQRHKRIYVETLLQKKIKLSGQWPDNARPRYEDNQIELNLARLDCISLESCNNLFNL